MQFEQAPPLSVPLRFFLTAPIFAVVAALFLLWQGPTALVSRWSPTTLAITHLLTLGFLASAMIGAMMQILPVVAGITVARIHLTAGIVHGLLTLGTLLLVSAFALTQAAWFQLALPVLASAFLWLIGACVIGLWRSPGNGATLASIRLALLGLTITVGLGLTMGGAFAWPAGWPASLSLMQLTRLHVLWGTMGWIGLLVIGVAYQVVPMFQVTPSYPQRLSRWLTPAIFALLALCSLASSVQAPGETASGLSWQTLFAGLIGIGLLIFGFATLYLQWRRKRPKPDVALYFWRTGMFCLILSVALWAASQLLPKLGANPAMPLMLGMLFLIGFAYSVINGMLYKIVPFLLWYHLQSKVTARGIVPNVKIILPDQRAIQQFWLHVTALLLLLAATLWPEWFTRAAAIVFGISSCWLWINLVNACRVHLKIRKEHAQYFE